MFICNVFLTFVIKRLINEMVFIKRFEKPFIINEFYPSIFNFYKPFPLEVICIL